MTTTSKILITAQDKTGAAFKSVQGGLKSISGALFSVQGLLAGVAGAAGFGALVKSSFAAADSLGKTADKLGVTTEALAGLRHAAAQTAGVTGKTLDTALQRMTRRVSEAAQGTGAAKTAIDELGLSAQELAGQSPDQQFKAIADAMSGVANQGDRVRLSMKLFDTEGVALVNTLSQGADALDAYAVEADALGLAISRVEARKIEMANDAFDRMGKSVAGVGNQVAVALAPTLKVLADDFTELSKDTDFWASATEGAVQFVGKSLAWLAEGVNVLIGAWHGFKLAIGSAFAFAARATERWATSFAEMAAKIPFVGEEVAGVYKSIAEAAGNMALSAEDEALRTQESLLARADAMGSYLETWEGYQARIREVSTESADSVIADQRRMDDAKLHSLKLEKKDQKERAAALKKKRMKHEKDLKLQEQAEKNYMNAARTITDHMFQDNKIYQAAMIVVDTAAAVTKTLASVPYPANVAAAAQVAAMGAVQLATVRSSTKAAGGGSGGGGLGGSGAPVGGDPVSPGQIQEAAPAQEISISIGGGLYSGDQIRELIDAINEQSGDGARLVAI